MVQSHSIQINTGKIPFHHSGAAGSIFRIAIQIVRGKGKQIFQRFGLAALLNRKRIRIRIPLLYGSNDSRRHFFHPNGNLKLLQDSFAKGIPIRQFNPACCGIFARSGLVNGRKIPCDRKCFLPDFFPCCYSGANGLIPKSHLIDFLQVIIRRCGSKGQGKSRQGEQFAFILYFCDKDEGCFGIGWGCGFSSKCWDTANKAEEAGQTAPQNTPVYFFHSHTIPPIPEKTY